MTIERPVHEGLEARIADAIAPSIESMGYELVRVQVSGKVKPVVQIMADRADGALFTVRDCEAISHQVSAVLDVDDPIKSEWNLEVSSPGIDRPLTRTKDYLRYLGHLAIVEMSIPVEGRRRFRGLLLGADPAEIRIKTDEGPEATLARGNIRRAKLVLTDELIAATAGEVAGEEEVEEIAAKPSRPQRQKKSAMKAAAAAQQTKGH
ncbi:MAG: ribosome maturation factor RimP [Rubritepida sp.]|nr:ribosome maturation factor RimP [Rubritepida sp.]